MEKVVPEAVSSDERGDKSIAYSMLIPHLIETSKFYNRQLTGIRGENKLLREHIKKLSHPAVGELRFRKGELQRFNGKNWEDYSF